ncbi:hypothetical protein E2320_006546 [Naja naja]|nr:hypothetical protein E2320_006546 [Naja naja]
MVSPSPSVGNPRGRDVVLWEGKGNWHWDSWAGGLLCISQAAFKSPWCLSPRADCSRVGLVGKAERNRMLGRWRALKGLEGSSQRRKRSDEPPAATEDFGGSLPGWRCFQGSWEVGRGWAQGSRMQLACLFIVSVLSLASLTMSRVEASRAHPANFHPKHKKKTVASLNDDWKEGEEEEEEKGEGFRERIVRRAVRKYPEDAGDHVEAGHRQISIPMGRAEGSCPEVLAKGTLAVVVAALAFLGFFSTSVLLVVAVCILRMVDKQRKIGKEGKSGYPPSRRTLPPMPHAPEDGYLSVSELNPGPRTRQKLQYQNVSESSPPKTPVERERIIPEGAQPFSRHDNHIYEQVE